MTTGEPVAIRHEPPQDTSRCGVVALIGAPNAGKSTLLNALVGGKVSIVTHKAQTTRTRVRGVAIDGTAQIVFTDTPGLLTNAKGGLEKAMVTDAWAVAEDADVILMLHDASRRSLDEQTLATVRELKALGKPCVLALNKIDRVRRDSLLALAQRFNDEGVFERIYMISAETGDGVADVRSDLSHRMPEAPWLYPEDQLSDLPMRLLAAEVTREKLFLNVHEEVPYSVTVDTDAWTAFDDGSVRIDQTIYVQREQQKRIIVGRGGATIRAIRTAAQRDLEAELEQRVHLVLFVKVQDWLRNWQRFVRMGGTET
ncbi:GTP-binding protein Era [Limimonas halophila]|uniref:GTPase Era n=1 Tax=Limimonas halophila TaxID=1082479 RepID=A0A1G7P1D2_9PROT|nr:GTPase Era [Limimonas halophila]SDF80063.1 GTP-binding protein Era [Limimonas halophila]